MGVDEWYRGKQDIFLTVGCNLETAEPLWFGRERKKETLDEFFRSQWSSTTTEADGGPNVAAVILNRFIEKSLLFWFVHLFRPCSVARHSRSYDCFTETLQSLL
jgi:hypothetical protein